MCFFINSKHICLSLSLSLCRWWMVPVPADSDPPQPVRSSVGHVPLPLPGSRGSWHWCWLCGLQARGPKWRWLNGNSSLHFSWWWVLTAILFDHRKTVNTIILPECWSTLDGKGIKLMSHMQTYITRSIILTPWNGKGLAGAFSSGLREIQRLPGYFSFVFVP